MEPVAGDAEQSGIPAEVVLLQPVALVDHLCTVDEPTARRLGAGELGGSSRCTAEQLQQLLAEVGEFTCRAGGSASNVARGLSTGFGVATAVVGACGTDEWGSLWQASMNRSGVSTKHIVKVPGSTGRSAVLLAAGERTCRTHLDANVTFPGEKLQQQHLQGAAWLFVSGYACYQDRLLPTAVAMAKELGVKVALDLGSWEVVTQHWETIQHVLQQNWVDLCFCNQAEATALCQILQLSDTGAESVLHYLLQYCTTAVVTLGARGCCAGTHAGSLCSMSSRKLSGRLSRQLSSGLPAAQQGLESTTELVQQPLHDKDQPLQDEGQRSGGQVAQRLEIVHQPGVAGVRVVDVTGAGDMFAAGFLHGMLRGWTLQRCAEAACLSGAAAVQVLGADVGHVQLHWMHQKLLGPHAASVLAAAAGDVAREQLAAYGLVEKIGRGVVYFGSARVQQGHSWYQQTKELAAEIAEVLEVPTWTGGGPGLMQAATEGALAVDGVVGGIRIAKEAGTTVLSGGYLPEGCQVMCHQLFTRKSGLIQAARRVTQDDITAFIFLPGGLGTMDELFELLTLLQLRKLPQQMAVAAGGSSGGGNTLMTPVVLVDYDGFYQGFVTFLKACSEHGLLKHQELTGVAVAKSNTGVIKYLLQYYSISDHEASSSDSQSQEVTLLDVLLNQQQP